MSIPFDGFCGPSYQYSNKYAAVERTVNWYLNANESPEEKKFRFSLAPSPGNALFTPLPIQAPYNQPNRGLLTYRGSVYGVNGNTVFALGSDGTFRFLGNVVSDGAPVSMVGNGNGQIGIASAGQLYVISNGGTSFTPVLITSEGFLGASQLTFQDGYLIALTPNSNQFQISGTDDAPIGDMTKWSAANVSIQAGQADLLSGIISSREYLRLLGVQRSQIYQDVGNQGQGGFPFQSYNETFIETGIAAPHSLVDMGDSLIWIGQDSRGFHTCWRDAQFQPRRISTFAVEQQWATYPTIQDAISFAYIWKGHLIYRITFPGADKSWEYDQTVSDLIGRSIWTERNYTDGQGNQHARPEQSHCFAYGLHLVGSAGIDGIPGAIYQYSDTAFTEWGLDGFGNPGQREIVRDRICPHIWEGNKRIVYNRIEFELERGIGLDGQPAPGTNPQILIRWSNDGGNTWSPEYQIPASQIGQYGLRVYLNRCGYGRDRVFWIRCSDPVYWGFVAAELDLQECAS